MHIELRALTKAYKGMTALDRVSAEIAPGQIIALLGANGAGKSTLLRCLAGLIGPTSGHVLYDEQEFSRARLDLRKRFLFLPDFPFVFPDMTTLQNLGMVLRIYEAEKPDTDERVLEVLKQLDLLPLALEPIHTLSRGQAYKAALAALLVLNPELWILDEPFASGMDPHGFTTFKNHARAAAQNGRTIIYSTQILELAESFSDRVMILDRGELRAFETVDKLREQSQGAEGTLAEVFRKLREEKA